MAQYRKKPIVIEAEQFVIWDLKNIPDNITILGNRYVILNSTTPYPYIVIPALGGNVKCYHLDWVCKGIQDELYPCKPDIFEKTYNKVELEAKQDFGQALAWLKIGKKVAREGWNGSGMFAYYVPANSYPATTDIAKEEFGGKLVPYRPYLALKTAQNDIATWNPSTSDCLAEDWFVVE